MSSPGGARRIAVGTGARVLAEVIGKLASLAFFVAIARELGEDGLGDFVFAVSLAGVLFAFAGIGTDQLLIRDVARDPERAKDLLPNAVALKLLISLGLLPILAAATAIAGYPGKTVAAVAIIGAGAAVEVVTKSAYSIFQARERVRYMAASLILQRAATAGAGIAALLAGGDLLAVACVFLGGSLAGLASAWLWLHGRLRQRWSRPRLSALPAVARAGVPIGLAFGLFAVLLRLDAVLLGFIEDSAEVGAYGAAIRIVFATKLVTWAFSAASLPWLSRQAEGDGTALRQGYEIGLKTLIAVLLPVSTALALLAEPVIELLFGAGFDDAVLLLRILAVTIVLYGINSFTATLMVSRSEPGGFARPAAVVLAQNAAFNLALIPLFGAVGAAANAVASGALLAGITAWRASRIAGLVSPLRILLGPAVSTAALSAVILAFGAELEALPLAAAALAALVVFVVIERIAFERDLRLYAGLLRAMAGGRQALTPAQQDSLAVVD